MLLESAIIYSTSYDAFVVHKQMWLLGLLLVMQAKPK